MSKKKKNQTEEPWEQPIYDTESDENMSRSEQHKQKRGNSTFLTIVVVLLILIVAIPVVAGIWSINRNNDSNTAASTSETTLVSSTSSSTVASSTSESTTSETSTSTLQSSTETSESTEAPVNDDQKNEADTTNDATDQDQIGAEYTTVLEGEGPNQVAARNGISVETLYQLNGISADDFFFSPGDQLRIK